MENNKALRQHLVSLLTGDSAHLNFDATVKDLPANLHDKKPNGAAHTPWEVLEHLRIAQWDLLQSIHNPKHVSPDFPSGYWPKSATPPESKAWDKSVSDFRADLAAFVELITNDATDVLAPLPQAEDQTIMRKVCTLADHNAYHLGELVTLRRVLGAWEQKANAA